MNHERFLGYVISEQGASPIKPKIIAQTDKTITFKAILQEGNRKNRNGRIYPTSLLETGFRSAYVKERLNTNTWAGECDHPMDMDLKRQSQIKQSNVSHFIKAWERDGDIFSGIIQTSCRQVGTEMMNDILENNTVVAFSARAMAPVKANSDGVPVVQAPFHLFCYDHVLHPSHDMAYMENALSESMEFVQENSGFLMPISASDVEEFAKTDGYLCESLELLNMDLGDDASLAVTEKGDLVASNKDSKIILNVNEDLHHSIDDWLLRP